MKVFVAGASGRLGSEVIGELKKCGYQTRALVRDAKRLGGRAFYADEVFAGDARDEAALVGSCDGVDVVISAMGASLQLGRTRDQATYRDIDYQANLNLLEEAKRAGVRKFIYVSIHGAEKLRGVAYVDAHEDFVAALRASGIAYTVVRPTGFFYMFEELFEMAERGRILLIDEGLARTNPIHEQDVARVCVSSIQHGVQEVSIGGPEVFTRQMIARLVCSALGRKPKFKRVPAWLVRSLSLPLRLFDRRLYELLDFGVAVSTVNAVARPVGRHSLIEYFNRRATAREVAQEATAGVSCA